MKPTIINGNVKNIEHTNLNYIEPHKVIIKPALINKSNFTISNEDIDKIKKYIEQTNDTASNWREANDINIVLKEYEDGLIEHSNEVRNLKKKIKN